MKCFTFSHMRVCVLPLQTYLRKYVTKYFIGWCNIKKDENKTDYYETVRYIVDIEAWVSYTELLRLFYIVASISDNIAWVNTFLMLSKQNNLAFILSLTHFTPPLGLFVRERIEAILTTEAKLAILKSLPLHVLAL